MREEKTPEWLMSMIFSKVIMTGERIVNHGRG